MYVGPPYKSLWKFLHINIILAGRSTVRALVKENSEVGITVTFESLQLVWNHSVRSACLYWQF